MENRSNILSLEGVNIVRRLDNYINATALCNAGNKKFNHWNSNLKTKEFLQELSNILEIPQNKLVQFQKGGQNQMTWVHPLVATNIAQWISPIFSIKISIWIEEWKNSSDINETKYITSITNLQPSPNSQKELEIKNKLHQELGGIVECETDFGFIDLLTDTEIIEIKIGKNWKHGLGQLCAYSQIYPNHSKRLHLFDFDRNEQIEKVCEKFGVVITYEK